MQQTVSTLLKELFPANCQTQVTFVDWNTFVLRGSLYCSKIVSKISIGIGDIPSAVPFEKTLE